MAAPLLPPSAGTSTRSYLIRALHDWCSDNGFTPYVAVFVDASVKVPVEYVKNNEIVLNVGFEATTGLKLGNDFIEFKARFGGRSRDILVPVDHVIAIYARENGQGMAFPPPTDASSGAATKGAADASAAAIAAAIKGPKLALADAPLAFSAAGRPQDDADEVPPDPPSGGRPTLKRVK